MKIWRTLILDWILTPDKAVVYNPVPSAPENNGPENNKRQKLIDNSSAAAEKGISIRVGRSPLKTTIYSASDNNNNQLGSTWRNDENIRSLFDGATIKENVIPINVVNNYNQQPRVRRKYVIYDSDED